MDTNKIWSHQEYQDQVLRGLTATKREFTGINFNGSTFQDCDFQETEFQNCRFINCEFINCELSLVRFPASSFSGVNYRKTRLAGVDWTAADWTRTSLGLPLAFFECLLNHSTFIGLQLPGLKMINCLGLNVDFREADLREADFSGTDLSGSLFHHTNLRGADLRQARNYQIDPAHNELRGASFSLPEALALLYSMEIHLDERD